VTRRTAVEEIIDAEHEQVLQRVAAVDVGKQSGMVCIRLPVGSTGRRVSRVWSVPATTAAVSDLAVQLGAARVQRVTIESTSDYWRIWFYLLEAAGLDVQLVNARQVKNVPGRPKTDKLDAVWLAKLTERGMLRPSFVPPPAIRVLRDYTRLRTDLTHERTRHWQRLEKLLEDALIKVSTVASTLDTVSTRAMLEALIAGQRDPRVLAGLARGRMRTKHAELVAALTGRFDDHHGELARILLNKIDALDEDIDRLTSRVDTHIAAIPAAHAPTGTRGNDTGHDQDDPARTTPLPVLARLDEIPGLGALSAQTVIAEIGLDMTRFPTPEHLTAWAKLVPRTIQSGARHHTGKTGKGNPYLKAALGNAAATAARTNTFLGDRYRRLAKRRGKLKALVAVARSILTIIWHLINDPTARFHDLGPDYHLHRDTQRQTRNYVRRLEALGHTVTLNPAA
jgi:transposase